MPSLLETFFIMFDSNADKVKRGNEEARKSTDDLESSLHSADGAGVALGQSLLATFSEVAAGLAAGFGIEKIKDAILETANYDAQLGLTSKRLNIAVEDLDAWEKATIRAGGAQGELTQSLDFLNRGMADIATKGTSRLKPFFDELKIHVTDAPKHVRPLLDILLELSDKAQKMGTQQFAGVAEKLGLGQGLTLLVQSGRSAIEDLVHQQKELGGATKESAAAALVYRTQTIELSDVFEELSRDIGSSVVPALTNLFKWVQRGVEYLEAHRSLVEGFFVGVSTYIVGSFVPALVKAGVGLAALGAEFLEFAGVGLAFEYLASLPLLIPIAIAAAIAAVIALFALLYDDIHNFLVGNKSVLGELKKAYPETFNAIVTVLQDAAAVVKWFVDLNVAAFNFWRAVLVAVVLAVNDQLKSWGQSLHAIAGFAVALGEAFAKAFPGVVSFFKEIGGWVDWLWDKFKAFLDWVSGGAFGVLGKIWEGIKATPGFLQGAAGAIDRGNTAFALSTGRGSLANASASPFNTAAGVGGARTSHITIGTLTVQAPAGSNPSDFADAISKELQHQLRDTANHFDDGVDR